jgi:hypothetical protein
VAGSGTTRGSRRLKLLSVREHAQHGGMLVVTLVCSDRGCAAEHEAWSPEPRDLDRLMCDCGCALVAIAYSEATPV